MKYFARSITLLVLSFTFSNALLASPLERAIANWDWKKEAHRQQLNQLLSENVYDAEALDAALIAAAKRGNVKAMALLLKYAKRKKDFIPNVDDALRVGVGRGHIAMVPYLVSVGASIDAVRDALILSVRQAMDSLRTLERLRRDHANAGNVTEEDRNRYHMRSNRLELMRLAYLRIITLLIEAGADNLMQALNEAIANGDVDVTQKLLDALLASSATRQLSLRAQEEQLNTVLVALATAGFAAFIALFVATVERLSAVVELDVRAALRAARASPRSNEATLDALQRLLPAPNPPVVVALPAQNLLLPQVNPNANANASQPQAPRGSSAISLPRIVFGGGGSGSM
jgi:ankyrin repeat protein